MTVIFSDDFDTGFTDGNGLPARDPSTWLEWADGTELLEDDGSWEVRSSGTTWEWICFNSWLRIGIQRWRRRGKANHNDKPFHNHWRRCDYIRYDFGDDTNGGEDPDQLVELAKALIYLIQ